MRRVLRAGFAALLIVAIVVAFSVSYADDSAPRRLCDSCKKGYGFRLARQGSIIYALPAAQVEREKTLNRDVWSAPAPTAAYDEAALKAVACEHALTKTFNSSVSLVSIYVNHPHHAPPFAI